MEVLFQVNKIQSGIKKLVKKKKNKDTPSNPK